MIEDKKSCPSAPFKKGHSIFGYFKNDNLIFPDSPIKIDDDFLDQLDPRIEKAEFRVTMKCVTKGCGNWNGQKCTVPDQMNQLVGKIENAEVYMNCPLKTTCRWFAQDAEEACKICPLIKTKLFGT